ncbi:hypothetical protein EJB05_49775, partial [Eragrostis curvula]
MATTGVLGADGDGQGGPEVTAALPLATRAGSSRHAPPNDGERQSNLKGTSADTTGDREGTRPHPSLEGVAGAMVVFQEPHDKAGGGEDDDVIDLDDDELEEDANPRWLAIGRFYSSKRFNLKGLFDDLSGPWGLSDATPARPLDDNLFLIEFGSSEERDFVCNGGPWIHKNDAVIMKAYDGLRRPSDVKIESIALWVRIYDIPETKMTTGYARKLGEKLGEILEVGGAVRDFLRVRVDFPLEKALKPEFKIRDSLYGVLTLKIKYEKVPHFCFICGRIGHTKRECPDEGLVPEVNYGEELRCSPLKRAARQFFIPASTPGPKRALNYSGEQRARALAASTSRTSNRSRVPNVGRAGQPADGARATPVGSVHGADNDVDLAQINKEVTSALVTGVQGIAVDSPLGNANMEDQDDGSKQKVSWSGNYDLTSVSSLSEGERTHVRSWKPAPKILGSISDLANNGMDIDAKVNQVKAERSDENSIEETAPKRSKKSADASSPVLMECDGSLPYGMPPSSPLANNLTGPHGEARQEQ